MMIDSNHLVAEKLEAIRETLLKENAEDFEQIHDGFTAGIRAEVIEELPNPEDEINQMKKEAQQLQEEAKALLEKAKEEAEQIKASAKEEAEQIRQAAKEEGKNQGYQEGTQMALAEIAEEKNRLEEERQYQMQEYERQVRQIEPELVEVILEVFQKVTHVLEKEKKDIVLQLVDNALEHTESSKEFLIRVSKEDYNFVNEHKTILEEKIPNSSNMEVVKDVTLKRNQCFIETDGGVFDCSLDTQLENLISDLKALSIE